MQYYMMQMELGEHIVTKDLATATWLVEVQIFACLVKWLDYFFVFT